MTRLSRKATIFFEQYLIRAGLEREIAEGREEERWEKNTEEREGRGRTPPPMGSPGPGMITIFEDLTIAGKRAKSFPSLSKP
eukprot:CAMPEP_0201538666 /NCGR_PEP_ID=MMETSP0161_2-20130828/68214_1 /ASSEMBLY_ACC=CAM_ASM_000251 /TAXON_ID=180227 /ORGANISM="Neoparamoeba aestuarina, Strain SoJaBio B1-5/56/2" /LENGTH=81 /DNA_ID=CAMNT_0047945629 /DNA_START=121 /DNA_END=363 /DNA_ORIENTATION=+